MYKYIGVEITIEMQTTHFAQIGLTIETNMTYDRDLYKLPFETAVKHFAELESGAILNRTAVKKESEERPVDHYNHRSETEVVSGKSLHKSLEIWEQIQKFVLVNNTFKHVIFNGIGGSYLGPYMLITALMGDDYNMQ